MNSKIVVREGLKIRKTDKDVFLARRLADANFDTGFFQVPEIPDVDISKPLGLVTWSKRNYCREKSQHGLCFYEYDFLFDGKNGIYNLLKYGNEGTVAKLIQELKEFSFVICPDYSVYGNFPNYKQIEAMARSREVGYILSTFGVKVIVNFRATYKWSYELALSGFSKRPVVAIGTLGAIKENQTRNMLKASVEALVSIVKPRIIIVYGSAPSSVFQAATDAGVELWRFDSQISNAFKLMREGERWE